MIVSLADIDECKANSTLCNSPGGNLLCLNTYGGYRCVTLFGALSQPALDAQQMNDVSDQADTLDSSVDSMAQSTGRLAVSFYGLIAWVLIITLCLGAVVVITLRRWQQRRAKADDAVSYDDSVSMGSSYAAGPTVGLSGASLTAGGSHTVTSA